MVEVLPAPEQDALLHLRLEVDREPDNGNHDYDDDVDNDDDDEAHEWRGGPAEAGDAVGEIDSQDHGLHTLDRHRLPHLERGSWTLPGGWRLTMALACSIRVIMEECGLMSNS